VEKWSGVDAAHLAEAVASKIPSSIGETVWLKVARKAFRRPVAIGYTRSQPQSAGVWHVFARDGIAELCRALMAALPEGMVRTSCPVTRITVDGGSGQRRVTGVEGPWGSLPADLVMTTAPANVLPHLVPDAPEIAELSRLRYRPMVFVNLKLEGRGILPDTVLWMPQRDQPFFRLTDTTDAMPTTAPAGHSVICVDYGAQVGDEVWEADEETLIASTTEHLRSVLPEVARRVHGGFVQRIKAAYPVYDLAYEDVRQHFETHGAGIAGLESIGRNGEFGHLLMEDVYWRTRWRVQGLAA
jgi:protoporphyrinogen oxidase